MAELTVSGRMKVKTLKKDFQEAFGTSLRGGEKKGYAIEQIKRNL